MMFELVHFLHKFDLLLFFVVVGVVDAFCTSFLKLQVKFEVVHPRLNPKPN